MSVPSTTARFKAVKQAAKGTALTTGFICGMLTRSSLFPRFDLAEKGAEHGCGGLDRATVHRSPSMRSSYMAVGSARGALYPDLIGVLLCGAGFTPVTTGAGTDKTHTFKLSLRSAVSWLTVLETIGDETLRGTDMRVEQLTVEAKPEGITFDAALKGLKIDYDAGSETNTAETNVELLPSLGTCTVAFDPAGTPATMVSGSTDYLTGASFQIANPMDDERSLWEFRRGDLPQRGVDITGRVEGVALNYDNYERIINGADAATDPSASTAICSVAMTWQSASYITGVVPYSLTLSVPRAEVSIDDFVAEGDSIVRWNFNWRMIDNTTDPVVITLVNAKTSY